MQDSKWLSRLCSGDEAAFAELVRQMHPQMLAVARGMVGDAIADEVVQEAWISIHRNLSGFEQRSSIKTWIYTIVCNGARSRLRQEKKHRGGTDNRLEPTGMPATLFDEAGAWREPPSDWHLDTPEQLLEESQLQECIEKTLTLLPEQQRAVFTLREIEQLDLSVVRNKLDLSESNVRVLLHRARLQLFQVINHYQETGTC